MLIIEEEKNKAKLKADKRDEYINLSTSIPTFTDYKDDIANKDIDIIPKSLAIENIWHIEHYKKNEFAINEDSDDPLPYFDALNYWEEWKTKINEINAIESTPQIWDKEQIKFLYIENEKLKAEVLECK